jgi:hypothetical protein
LDFPPGPISSSYLFRPKKKITSEARLLTLRLIKIGRPPKFFFLLKVRDLLVGVIRRISSGDLRLCLVNTLRESFIVDIV